MVERIERKSSVTLNQASMELSLGQFLKRVDKKGFLDNLTSREKIVLKQHWIKGLTLAQIAPVVGVTSREQVRNIENKAWEEIMIGLPAEQKPILSSLLENKRHDPKFKRSPGPETRKKISQALKKKWRDSEYRERIAKSKRLNMQTAEYREKISQRRKEVWQNPKYRRKMIQGIKSRWRDPEFRQKMTGKFRRRSITPEFRQKMSEIMKERWKDPKYRQEISQTLIKIRQKPKYRQNMSNKIKKLWQNPEFRRKQELAKEKKTSFKNQILT